ncbi:sensor histidine kinase, partial [Rhizobium leguminosarum]
RTRKKVAVRAATALYVDSVIAPLLPNMQTESLLEDASAQALDETLGQGALGKRLVSFKMWRNDGTILYSKEKELVGKTFAVSDKLKRAFAGSL